MLAQALCASPMSCFWTSPPIIRYRAITWMEDFLAEYPGAFIRQP
jgi:hypothetical protein